MLKYPRTPHLEGSGLQAGDEDMAVVPLEELAGRYLVVEEKMDGANSAISFSAEGELLLQSRGHYLTGGERERQFDLLKSWASRRAGDLWDALGDRYVLYGEWLFGKHSIFYDSLPHYFLAYDLFDRKRAEFLSTDARLDRLAGAPFVQSVPVLYRGPFPSHEAFLGLVGPSTCISEDQETRLREQCARHGQDFERVWRETDHTRLMEGLYVKVEEGGLTRARYKFVRSSFLQTVLDSGSHWSQRPILPNLLRPGVDLFA